MKIEKDIKVQVESRIFFCKSAEKKDRQKPLIHVKIYKFQKKALRKGLWPFLKAKMFTVRWCSVLSLVLLRASLRLQLTVVAALVEAARHSGGSLCTVCWNGFLVDIYIYFLNFNILELKWLCYNTINFIMDRVLSLPENNFCWTPLSQFLYAL